MNTANKFASFIVSLKAVNCQILYSLALQQFVLVLELPQKCQRLQEIDVKSFFNTVLSFIAGNSVGL